MLTEEGCRWYEQDSIEDLLGCFDLMDFHNLLGFVQSSGGQDSSN